MSKLKLSDATSADQTGSAEPSVEAQMLSALELFHYESRFRESVFVIALEPEISLDSIITDLRVIEASDIKIILFCRDTENLAASLSSWTLRGTEFTYFAHPLGKDITKSFNQTIRKEIQSGAIPVIALSGSVKEEDPKKPFTSRAMTARAFALQALDTAQDFNARKVFFVSSFRGLEVDGKRQSHPSEEDIQFFLKNSHTINIGKDQLNFIQEQFVDRGIEIVLLEGKSGVLFQEIFSHRGKGTLFTEDYPNIIRQGELSDVTDISLLMKPSIASGIILPVSEDDIAKDISSYIVYTINGAIVGSAKLVEYPEACELAKFSTFPRFQGKGRARKLALAMIEQARGLKKRYVFALSIEPKMWEFFEGLGFEECSRDRFPQDWLSNYDLSRPSKGFILLLTEA